MDGVGHGKGQLQGGAGATNPDCPNAANPFHRCAEYCPVPPPRPPPVPNSSQSLPTPPLPSGRGKAVQNGDRAQRVDGVVAADSVEVVGDTTIVDSEDDDVGERRRTINGSAHSDGAGEQLHPIPILRRRDNQGGGIPVVNVYPRDGSDGEGKKKVDPRCPNAPNPFHACTEHCLAKLTTNSSTEGGKSPLSIFSRRPSSSSQSQEGSVKSGGSRKADPKCPKAANPFHECGEYCVVAKIQQVDRHKGSDTKSSPRKKGGKEKDVALMQNWKADPRCPNASNPFHICAQYCFDHSNEAAQLQANTAKSDKRKGKAVLNEAPRGEINPDCANASNPYHRCGEHCKGGKGAR